MSVQTNNELDLATRIANIEQAINGGPLFSAPSSSAPFNMSAPFTEFVVAGVTAHSGGTQALAVALTGMINQVSTVAAAADSVALPPSKPGLQITVVNTGANPLQVFGAGTDTINNVATATGVSQAVNARVTYTCVVAGNWITGVAGTTNTNLVALSANGAINPHQSASYVITKGSLAALTLAAPTVTVDDGVTILVTSNTAFAHTITATGLFQDGGTTTDVATCAVHPGASLLLIAVQGKWNTLYLNAITMS